MAAISISDENAFLVSFSEPLSRDLVKDDILLEVDGGRDDGYEYTWELIEQDEFVAYVIAITFEHDDIPKGTTLRVGLSKDLADSNDVQITETSLELEIPEEKQEETSSQYTN